MSRKLPSETEITWRVLNELEAFQGIYWQEVQGQFQGDYDEIAIWILLADSDALPRAHRRFRDVVSPHFYLARFTVSYTVRTPDGEVILDFLDDNDEIERAGISRPLGEKPYLKSTAGSVFSSPTDLPPTRPPRHRRHVH